MDNHPQRPSATYKIVLLGDAGVGKTSIALRVGGGDFSEHPDQQNQGDYQLRTVKILHGTGQEEVKVQVWDTAGQERMRTLTSSYYRGTHGVFLIYDVSDADSFQHIERWLEQLYKYCGSNSDADRPLVFLVSNKSDLQHLITTEMSVSIAEKLKLRHLTVSAKDNSGIEEALQLLVKDIISEEEKQQQPTADLAQIVSTQQQHRTTKKRGEKTLCCILQ